MAEDSPALGEKVGQLARSIFGELAPLTIVQAASAFSGDAAFAVAVVTSSLRGIALARQVAFLERLRNRSYNSSELEEALKNLKPEARETLARLFLEQIAISDDERREVFVGVSLAVALQGDGSQDVARRVIQVANTVSLPALAALRFITPQMGGAYGPKEIVKSLEGKIGGGETNVIDLLAELDDARLVRTGLDFQPGSSMPVYGQHAPKAVLTPLGKEVVGYLWPEDFLPS